MANLSAIFLLLFQLCLHARAEGNEPRIIQLGSSLSPITQPSWASSSGHFEFGFYREGNGFAVGIWIVGHQGNTVVWTANRDDPLLSSRATLELTKQGELLLRAENSQKLIAYPVQCHYTNNSVMGNARNYSCINPAADSASMLDSGNFVLYRNDSVIWESFDFPTDTILGGQNLSSYYALKSSVSRSNHSTGPFWLDMQSDGNLVAYLNSSSLGVPYWALNTSGSSYNALNLNEQGIPILYGKYVLPLANSSQIRHEASQTQMIYRATFDPDGIFRIYSHQIFEGNNNISSNATKLWQNMDDPCEVKGICGLNSYCSTKGTEDFDFDFDCYCYPGFTFVDENAKYFGCSQNFTIDACQEMEDQEMQYNISVLDNMTWTGVPYNSSTFLKVEDCKNACQQDCFCGGVLYSNGNCDVYSLPLRYAKRREDIPTMAFIKVVLGRTPIGHTSQISPMPNEGNSRLLSIMGISLGSVACICLLIAVFSFLMYRHRVQSYRKLSENYRSPGLNEQFMLQSFSFSELEKATDGFKVELGKGSVGVVYKGVLPGDKDNKPIAVKKLDKVINEREREFQTEMTVIGRTNHRNLVRLLGFCMEGSRNFLVYEYLSNGSLVNFLFNVNKERPIWKERARIALDVAKGILYLHEECEICVIHCNIKPQNILLDNSMTAKISDFGLAKLWRQNQTSIIGIKGTTRYLAPEWQRNALLSVKVDVYSFGVILLEIICCRSSIEVKVSNADEILLSTWVYNCFVDGELNKLVEGEEVDMKMLERFVKVGLWCIQDDPNLRPLMKNVTLMLEGTMDVPLPPSPSLSHHVTTN